ncbi:hypothetical protein [Paraburkholderia sp. SOS3]|jgi:hypothetical protein|uniref:hypothetical protein n=1 Tax=Paraburkholderia sp. SOS3 TaxID=1926494 RepID=UPI0009476F87|nr:hypothetical protein [Paraburkholderia sp. SOS3]APR38397.1 hypothetical protein BTO02_23175 [Paraburkholderia sp. SOS3]
MTYSCADFTADVMQCLVHSEAIRATDIPDDDPARSADMAVEAIVSMHRASLSSRFVRELLDEVDSLDAVASRYGIRALTFLFYLQSAILNESYIAVQDDGDAQAIALVSHLPSAEEWLKHIRMNPAHA